MSDDTIQNMKLTALPDELIIKVAQASAFNTCTIPTNDDGSGTQRVSSYVFFEDLAKHPDKYADAWKVALGTAAATYATMGLEWGVIVAAGPLAPFIALAEVLAIPLLGGNRAATLMIANQTDGAIAKKEVYLHHGFQTGRPAVIKTNPDTKSDVVISTDSIPEQQPLGDAGNLTAVGMYRFEKDLDVGFGWYGTEGAISFTCADPYVPDFAISWCVPQSGSPNFGATTDISEYASLEDFFDKTINDNDVGYGYAFGGSMCPDGLPDGYPNKEIIASIEVGIGSKVVISSMPRNYPNDDDDCDMVFTATIFSTRPYCSKLLEGHE